MLNQGLLLVTNDHRFLSARIDSGAIAAKASKVLVPAVLSMIRSNLTTRDRADRICRTFVWICKEQAFRLVSVVELLYTIMRETIRRYSVLDDSILYQSSERQNPHWTIIYQSLPLVLVDGSGAIRHLYG